MTLSRRVPIAVLVGAVFSLLLLAGGIVFSQTGQESGSGLSISPTRTELLDLSPSESEVIELRIRNVTNNAIVARPVINDFVSDNETERPQLILEDRDDLPSIKPFLNGLKDVTLQPGEIKTVKIPVNMPSDVVPGAYYGVIRYIAVPEDAANGPDPGQVSLTASVASIVLIEVPGDIQQQVQLREILVYRNNVAGTFFGVKPEEIGVRIQNQGSGFIKPFGSVVVTDPRGQEVHNYELNKPIGENPRSNILPKSTRVFRNPLEGVSLPGRYVVTANVSFGNGGEVLVLKDGFWYLPLWFTVLVILATILIGLAIYWAQKRVRRSSLRKKRR